VNVPLSPFAVVDDNTDPPLARAMATTCLAASGNAPRSIESEIAPSRTIFVRSVFSPPLSGGAAVGNGADVPDDPWSTSYFAPPPPGAFTADPTVENPLRDDPPPIRLTAPITPATTMSIAAAAPHARRRLRRVWRT
jgi:hypothetical protein